MPLFLYIFYLGLMGVLFAHLARKYAKVETTNRRWIVILIANGLLGGLISDPDATIGGWLGSLLVTTTLFVVSAKSFGRVSWLTAIAFYAIYLVSVILSVILFMILLGPEVFY